jgi:hypothetical protein
MRRSQVTGISTVSIKGKIPKSPRFRVASRRQAAAPEDRRRGKTVQGGGGACMQAQPIFEYWTQVQTQCR